MYECYVVKVIGDSLMMAFRTSSEAVQFAMEFSVDSGVNYIGIRVGIHSGQVEIRGNDIYGLNVNLTSRVQHALPDEGILVTDQVQRDYDIKFGKDSGVRFIAREADLKSFGKETVFFVATPELAKARRGHFEARSSLLKTGRNA
jgi:class 3 adenylate cyclase